MILEGLQVDGVDSLLFAHALVETLAALLPEPSTLDHLLEHVGQDIAVSPRIVRNRCVEVARDVRPDVDAYDVHQPETGAARQSDQRACERIHLFDRVFTLDRKLVYGGAEE